MTPTEQDRERASFTLSWGVNEPLRVLILTSADGLPPEDLLDAAREAFHDPTHFVVRVKLHPIRYNPTGRLWTRLREEWRHWVHLERPWWWMVGVRWPGRFPAHWRFLKSQVWHDPSYAEHLVWADVILYDSTSLWKQAKPQRAALLHWINRQRQWDYNPEKLEAWHRGEVPKSIDCGDPLTLRYTTYLAGREAAKQRGAEVWDRTQTGLLVLQELGGM